ncbi:MAG: patatin-like phospholipase family protein [Desulfovibrionaceae bacterium]|jgi:predicted acylesterase/phospholipase RssA|nr:patatin-like phospholipase family protein [Desulfovibrionaceae bacterium]
MQVESGNAAASEKTCAQDGFLGDKPFCDLVMKGGITSGVVYPRAILELARKYRLKSIGGTSAGAIAAAAAAAAEYARENGGFERLAQIPEDISTTLLDKFQPVGTLRPLFGLLMTMMRSKGTAGKVVQGLWAVTRGYVGSVVLGAAPGLVLAFFGGRAWGTGWMLLGLLLALLGALLAVGRALCRSVTRDLPAANYGICSGMTTEPAKGPALTDWLADQIDYIAGMPKDGDGYVKPLTFGDLAGHGGGIELAMVTTDLGMRRPYRLPFTDRLHFFSMSEFRTLFPERIVKYMVANTESVEGHGDLCYMPRAEVLPVVVATRMSLSFPGLLQAVPLYKRDFTLLEEEERMKPRKCLFSDGGLSSNFPIHFFDSLWPTRPTFGINLVPWVRERHGDGEARRVALPSAARSGRLLPIYGITGLGDFLMTLLDTAKDWQDTLQRVLPGCRERVVHIALDESREGGMNLAMSAETIARLTELGERAGRTFVEEFDFDEHRWRRFLLAMAQLEESLDRLAQSHDETPLCSDNYSTFLNRYDEPLSYKPQSPAWRAAVIARAADLATLGGAWRRKPTVRQGRVPKAACALRITPKM